MMTALYVPAGVISGSLFVSVSYSKISSFSSLMFSSVCGIVVGLTISTV